ncbi:ribonucleases P/MRP protein subunit POP1 [Adelges cooleyi]|uniref:ribonucleases P/MRP protein subunit POP1 n=1 Tax=Adelges cooleyi TaxID=133065 RepID=UPI00217F9739|nr:ribonucleases P/MRP protein subunit POP1 [Adelges cooleyi]
MEPFDQVLKNDPCHSRPFSAIDVDSFISSRNQEMQILLNEINVPKKNNAMIFQRLPKKMRRRVMSTTVKRMPRNLRAAHKKSIDKQVNKHVRRRKDHRRKPKSKKLDYIRRQKNGTWLETHVWFAKRFHMVVKDGYKLPKSSHDKTYRACFRAIGSHCLVQDISYISCLELKGPFNQLLEGLMHHVSQECGRTFKAKCYENGTREGTVFMYRNDTYPFGAIGRVSFIWDTNSSQQIRTLWMWSDPSIYKELADELQMTFDLVQKSVIKELVEPPAIKKPKLTEKYNVQLLQTPCFVNGTMKMTLLKDTLNRFRLTGPLSNSVLSRLLYPGASIKPNTVDKENWWLIHQNKFKDSLKIQKQLWESFSGADRPDSYPSNCVIGCNTVDPRLVFPKKRTKAVPTSKEFLLSDNFSVSLPPEASFSQIWDPKVRDWTTRNKVPNNKLNELRSKCVISDNDTITLGENTLSIIPTLLIQRPGQCLSTSRPGYGSGWDIVFPAGWAMPFWLGLIINGCQPGGMRETNTMVLERCLLQLAHDPDTEAGKLKSILEKREAMEKHFKLPPQMRINYIKLGFKTPFHCAWDSLCREWKFSTIEVFVLRNIKIIGILQKYILKLNKPLDTNSLKNEFPNIENCLISVRVNLSFKGVLKPNSHICLPTPEDMDNIIGSKSHLGPVENTHKDLNATNRKVYRLEHKKFLKMLRRKRVLEKSKRNVLCLRQKRITSPTSQIVKEYLAQMKKLWIPEEEQNIKQSCDRTILGFINNSHYSFTDAHCVGMGYIPGPALLELFNLWVQSKSKLPYVLVRNPFTLQYRFALLSIGS